ncbi:ABC transporter substrate-binding protein [Bradyrhizobium sp.]|uniref:ABC transporter substrate-binding protein n=1 Tax=Bradyrhizobium sp. TaxID=376 RepID=UPI0039E365A4
MPSRISRIASAAIWLGVGAYVGLCRPALADEPKEAKPDIKIGNTAPYSGAGSAYSLIARTYAAYVKKINDGGGINGRKINFISYDDAYSPPKAVEQVRRLVESDEVLFIFGQVATAGAAATQKYLNAKHVPQLFVGSPSARFGNPDAFPWTTGFQPSIRTEARIYVAHLLQQKPDARIAILYQNDDFGKDYRSALIEALGEKAKSMVVGESSYDVTEPTIDAHVVKLKATGADTFFDVATPKFTAQAIKRSAELDWKPLHFVFSGSSSIVHVLEPAGLKNSEGLISAVYLKDLSDQRWKEDVGVTRYRKFMKDYMPNENDKDLMFAYGYTQFQILEAVLQKAGDDPSREAIMGLMKSLDKVKGDLLIDGITASTSEKNLFPLSQLQIVKFDGTTWQPLGAVMSEAP